MIDPNLRKNTIPRINRKVANSIITTEYTLFGEETVYLTKKCTACKIEQSVHNFYVKPYKQYKKSDNMKTSDYRSVCIRCFDDQLKTRKRVKKANKVNIFDLTSFFV